MKRWIGSIVLASVVGIAAAQGNFTIVRPADGSKVREKIRVLIPKNSVPSGGYVGVFLDGKFLEARGPQSMVPESKALKEKYLEYILDSKALGLKDSEPGKPQTLEMVLYVDFSEHPRIVDRSSVQVYVGNKANIPIPSTGLKISYGFQPGTESIYRMDSKIALQTVTNGQNRSGGRANEQELGTRTLHLLYAVDNRYENGDGLVRIQALPDKGKDYTVVTLNDTPKKWTDDQLAPLYMRVTPNGMEQWSSLPIYFGLLGANGTTGGEQLFPIFPLPSLPAKPVRIGDSWQTRFLDDNLDERSNFYDSDKFTIPRPARGEFIGVEWESGHPCAVIKNSIKLGDSTTEGIKLKKAGAKYSDTAIELEETIWFSLDSKRVLKMHRTQSIVIRADQLSLLGLDGASSDGGAGRGGATPGDQGGGPVGGGPSFGKGGGLPGASGAGGAKGMTDGTGSIVFRQKGGFGGAPTQGPGGGPPAGFGGPPQGGGRPGGFGGQSRPGGPGGPGAFGPQAGGGLGNGRPGAGAGNTDQLAFLKVKFDTTFTLEE